ncbi:SDR family oxidoreductase [Salinisphaera sp. SPP-AMP-43]|uniref:SDR family oxidoreductase n=1 Tax=Salinisphaera sp. SPP-AMP-43 TaxID=3121288 RepID=UPI003C6E616B
MHSLIVGCGDTGVRVAARAVAAQEQVTGIVRSDTSAAYVRAVGGVSRQIDLDVSVSPTLPACDRLIYSAPPPPEGKTDARMAAVLAALPEVPSHVVYISTTGVYGDHGDEWIDETAPLQPATARAGRRVDAEQQIRAWAPHAMILRAPGIYGPDRLPVQRVLDGEPVLADSAGGWSNRIHIDDLASVVWAAANRHWPNRVYNVCDGQPTRRSAYYDTLAELLGVAPPPKIDWAEARQRFSAMRLSFLAESRRLSNARLLSETDVRLQFTDLRAGLIASLRGDPALAPGYD